MTYLAKAERYTLDAMAAKIMAINLNEGWTPKFVTLHNTASPSLAQWEAYSDAQKESWGDNLNAYYRRMAWHAGPHLAATPEPWSYVLCDLSADGVHASCFNRVSYGIEMVGDFRDGGDDPATSSGSAVVGSAINMLAALHVRFGWDPADYEYGVRGLHFHCECKADNHACPGALIGKPDIIARVKARMAVINSQRGSTMAMPLPTSTLAPAETPMEPTIILTPWPTLAEDPQFFNTGALYFNCWKALGQSNPFALGLLENAEAESSLNPKAVGDTGTAFNLHQHHVDRCRTIKSGCGIDLQTETSIPAIVKAVWWELNNIEKVALVKMQAATTAKDAGTACCVFYERAGAPLQAEKRGAGAERWADFFSTDDGKKLLAANPAPAVV